MNALRCEREVTERSGGTEERSPRCIRQRREWGVRKMLALIRAEYFIIFLNFCAHTS